MNHLIANLRIWQKSLVPIGFIAIVCGGVALYMSAAMTRIDDNYSRLVNKEAQAAVWGARSNATVVDTARLGWKVLVLPTLEEKKAAAAELASLKDQYANRLGKVRAGVEDPAVLANLVPIERDFLALHGIAMEAARLGVAGDGNAAAKVMTEKFIPIYAPLRTAISKFVDDLVRRMEQGSNDLTAETNAVRYTSLSIAAAGLALSVTLGVWIALCGIVRPVRLLTDAMTRLAASDWTTDVPGTARKDELGEMAKTVNVFKQNGIEADRLRTEQQAGQRRQIERGQKIEASIGNFEAVIAGVVNSVSSSATELQSTAQSMAATSEETSRQSTTVAAASEQATRNVQAVASATEQLSASVSEIGQQVTQAGNVIREAVRQAVQSNEQVKGLTGTAEKIGDVVKIISDIASQTNLLKTSFKKLLFNRPLREFEFSFAHEIPMILQR